MGVSKTFFRTLLLRSTRSGKRLSDILVTPEQLEEVHSMILELNESVAITLAKRQQLSARQVLLMTALLSASMLKLIKDVFGEEMFPLFKCIVGEQWSNVKDMDID
jgi:hypothetical protein